MSEIVDKIRQLRSLSTSLNVNEAAAAAAIADRLISKYRISEAQISLADKTASCEAQHDEFVLYETARIIRWKSNLSVMLSNHYDCALWIEIVYGASDKGHSVSQYRLVGDPKDMELTRYMFSWLAAEIARLCKLHCEGRGHIYCQSYCEGAVKGIGEQLVLAKVESRAEALQAGQSTALACLDSRKNKAEIALRILKPNLKACKTTSKRYIDVSAYNVGKEVGKNIHLGKSLGSGSDSKLLK
jgi:hypothetical protein